MTAIRRPPAPASTMVGASAVVGLPTTQSPTEKLRQRIQADPNVRKALVTATKITLNQRLTNELSEYVITARDLARPGFFDYKVNVNFMNPRKDVIAIIDAVLKIQAFRDRVCEIQLSLLSLRGQLQRLTKTCTDVIHERYGNDMVNIGLRSEAAYKQFIGTVLEPMSWRLAVIGNQLDQVEATLDNLDKSHYTYRDVGTLAEKILARSEGGYGVTRPPVPGA